MTTSVEEQHARIREVDPQSDINPSFQRLSLAIPIESKNYTFISLFLSRVLNVPHSETILSPSRDTNNSPTTTTPLEILPNVAFPSDLWLKDDIIVKDVKIKTSMLQDINAMIERELAGSNDTATLSFDENVLHYYNKLLNAYKVYDIPVRASVTSVYTPPDLSLTEEEEETTSNGEDYPLDDSKLIRRISSNQSSAHSQNTHHSHNHSPSSTRTSISNKHNSQSSLPNSKRGSALSRELTSHRKRFLTLLGYENYNGAAEHPALEEEHKKQQTLNSLLAKSRIYNKIKKNRELSSSVISTTSNPSSYSNRNSISTTNSTNSSTGSRRRGSSNYFAAPPDINESRFLAVQQVPPSPPYALLTGEQKLENRKLKYDYYVQLVNLMAASQVLVNFALQSNSTKNKNTEITTRFIDFIKKKVLKFIIIDISQMLMDYAQLKAYKFYNSG